jgi:amino-acid N-acetyltransferase
VGPGLDQVGPVSPDLAGDRSPVIRPAGPADRAAVLDLLAAADLPQMGVPATLDGFLVADLVGRVVGAVGLERHGPDGLLRSAVVSSDARGSGVGQALVGAIIRDAAARGLRGLYLLTTTAERYFPRFGFERIERADVPPAVQASDEFRVACPASAVVMRRVLAQA